MSSQNPTLNRDYDKLLTPKQVAEMLSISVETIRRWRKAGKLKAVVIEANKKYRYKLSDVLLIVKSEEDNG